jgi:hypothetical protein
MTRRRLIGLLAAAATTLAAATALGAPRTGTVTNGGPPYTWDGGPISGTFAFSQVGDNFNCGDPGKECDGTIVNFANGQATVTIAGTNSGSSDLDLYVWKANAQGQPVGDPKSSTGSTADETVTFPAEASPYLVRVVPAVAANGTYHGEAKEPAKYVPGEVNYGTDPADPGAGDGGRGVTTRANDLAPTTTARAPKHSASRVLRGTARDPDGKVAYVDVALVRQFARSCRALRPNGSWRTIRKCSAPPFLRARGTTNWSLRLDRPLAKGVYVLFARATDDLGRAEGGFGKANRVTFKIT